MSRVLYLRDSSDVPKFRLVISSISKVQAFDDWIYIAVRRNVVELDLHMVNDNNANRGFELPKGFWQLFPKSQVSASYSF